MIFPVAFIVLFSRCAGLLNPSILPGLEPPCHCLKRVNARPAHFSNQGPQPSGPYQQSTPGRAIARASRQTSSSETLWMCFGEIRVLATQRLRQNAIRPWLCERTAKPLRPLPKIDKPFVEWGGNFQPSPRSRIFRLTHGRTED